MKIEINLDEEKVKELVAEHLVIQVLAENRSNPESRDAFFGMRQGVEKAVKEYLYKNKDAIIERVIERASREMIKKGLPKFLEKGGCWLMDFCKDECQCEDCVEIRNQLINCGDIKLPIGTNLYRPAWDMQGEPFIYEEKITRYRFSKVTKQFQAYMTNKGGYSKNSIGKNVYLSVEEAEKNRRMKVSLINSRGETLKNKNNL